ncbi:hypothetical protein SAMN05442782_3099 [Streptomyces sp. OK228]|nr:hypothetical protein SAMN05442782_3099 [Streptomyces sp. OK228]
MVAILGTGLAFGRWDGLVQKERERRTPDSSGPASTVSYGCLRAFPGLSRGFPRGVANAALRP